MGISLKTTQPLDNFSLRLEGVATTSPTPDHIPKGHGRPASPRLRPWDAKAKPLSHIWEWLRRRHDALSFRLTQVLTGHCWEIPVPPGWHYFGDRPDYMAEHTRRAGLPFLDGAPPFPCGCDRRRSFASAIAQSGRDHSMISHPQNKKGGLI